MGTWFMTENGEHHRIDEGLWLHYPTTCNVHAANETSSASPPFVVERRSTAMNGGEIRLEPTRHGWVAILYETKGLITFFVQLSPTVAAWQRREWPAQFESNWNVEVVREGIANFIWVAECERQRTILPRLTWRDVAGDAME